MYIVNVKKENREKFIEYFEALGFKIDKRFPREGIIKSELPISLDFKTKEIGRIGNVTCAAAAASQGRVMKEDDFFGL